jgi:hypothetical protein
MITSLQEDIAGLQGYIQSQEQELFKVRMALASSKVTRQRRNGSTRGAKQRSAMHLLKKDQDHRENSSVRYEDVRMDMKSDMHSDLESDVNMDVHSDLERDLDRDHRENTIARNMDINMDVHRDVNKDLHMDQTVHSRRNTIALNSDLHSDMNRDVHSDQRENISARNLDVNKDLHMDVQSDMNMDQTGIKTRYTTPLNKDMQSDLDRDVNEDQIRITIGNKTVQKTKPQTSEAAKKIHRILRKNPNTGPAELAAKAGVSARYASHVKSQFLAILEDEQSG